MATEGFLNRTFACGKYFAMPKALIFECFFEVTSFDAEKTTLVKGTVFTRL